LHPSSVEELAQAKVKVIITVDCGITSLAAAQKARELGIDLIITDHHQSLPEVPEAYAVVDPNMPCVAATSPLRALAGVGVAFCLGVQIKRDLEKQGPKLPSLYRLLPYVTLGTICDLAPMNPLNLKLLRHGWRALGQGEMPWTKCLFSAEERQLQNVPGPKFSFNLGPMINSSGRMGRADQALQLLTTADPAQATEAYYALEISNRERKALQDQVVQEATAQIEAATTQHEMLWAIAYAPHWHEGVIGIVASKLVETFLVPAIVFTDSNEAGLIKGSARAAGEIDLMALFKQGADLFTKYGGHAKAAGITMPRENLPHLQALLDKLLLPLPAILRTKNLTIDAEIDPADISPLLATQIEQLEPFGNGHPRPIFRAKVTLQSFYILQGKHVRWQFARPGHPPLHGMSFNFIGRWGQMPPSEIYQRQQQGDQLMIDFTIGLNRWNGREQVQLMIERIFF
ncbi:MAG: hypothetical protein J6Y94_03445, partial [Bacteriovoracaceae bacterium]|nr:hypothetical protein [Bacteriovoracaceae bacterium]